MKLKAIDLFSGCGGLTLGLRQAGFHVAGAIELDPLAVDTYRVNHPKTFVWKRDIRWVRTADVMRKLNLRRGETDLLAGCPPCQGFSAMATLNGKKAGDDPRNDLIFQFSRFVRALQPRTIMLENVPGLGTDPRLHRLIRRFENLGYQCTYGILDAADFGVPQRRKRFILIGTRLTVVPFAERARRRRSVLDAFNAGGDALKLDPLHLLPEHRSEKIKRLISRIPKDGGSRADLGAEHQLPCHQRCNGFRDVYGRMAWHSVSPTITGGCFNPSKGRFLHPEENRTISMREAALLQSFPRNYYFSLEGGKTSVAQMIGNALPPEFIRRHALQLANYLKAPNRFDNA